MSNNKLATSNNHFSKGDVFKMNPNPTKGHEQSGYRPFVVLSKDLQKFSPHMLRIAPITSSDGKYPLHVPLETEDGIITEGVILCEHERTVDIMAYANSFKILDKVTDICLEECLKIIDSF